jgi:putative PEP-CTERM system histidine kinase
MLMAATGYYIRLYGGAWGGVVQVAFLFLALLLLLALLLSGQARARLKVLLNKHFFKNKYDYREEWLKFTDALAGEGRNEARDADPMQDVIRAFADIVDAPRGVLWLRQPTGYFQPASTYNAPLPADVSVPADSSLVRFLSGSGWIVYVDEFQRVPALYGGLVLPDWISAFREPWIIIPLLHGAELDGFIVLSRSSTPRDLNWEDSDLLKSCGRQAASFLALLKVSEALADARQFEAFNRLSAYVVHDLKNLVAQLSLVVSNARRHMHSPGFIEDAVDTVDNAAQKMNRLLMQLRKDRIGGGQIREVNLVTVMQSVIASRQSAWPQPTLDTAERELAILAEPDRLASILEHLVQNAQDATPDDGDVNVRIRRRDQVVEIEVADSGCGMDARFIAERLFRPFDTTKGNAGMGVGVYESREFVVAAGGNLEVESRPGEGTVFRVLLPLESAASGDIDPQLTREFS